MDPVDAEERKELLVNEEKPHNESPPPYANSYGATSDSDQKVEDKSSPPPESESFIVTHRARIPGYGLYRMIRKVPPYSHYVLLIMLIVYLLNQLDRYTLPIVTTSVGYDLNYGDKVCMVAKDLNSSMLEAAGNISSLCSVDNETDLFDDLDIKHDESNCENLTILDFEYGNETYHVCEWAYDGSGLLYQIVAGPVFNNLYPLAGIFTGFLADYGRRTIWLTISLVFWSLATGVTGFVNAYWQLVVLRALLAIGAAGCSPFAVSILADYYPPEFRGTSVGIYYWGIYIGYSLAFAIGNGIQQALSWHWVFFLSAIIGLAVAPLVILTVKEPKRTKNVKVDAEDEKTKLSLGKRFLLLGRTFIMPGMFMLCLAGGIRNAGGYVWAYNTELFFVKSGYSPDQISQFMSWIPLVSGSIGAVVGGLISDVLVKGRSPYMRIWVLIISQLAAAPFAAGALFLPYPWCFLTLIPSNVIGEMWIGVTTVIVVDLAPSRVRTGAVSIYLFIITIIGGNFNLLVPPIMSGFHEHISYLLSYKLTLLLTFPGVYALSSLLFLGTFFLMRSDLRRKARLEKEAANTDKAV